MYAASDSGMVERLHIETDKPEGLPAGGITTDVRFIEVSIDRTYAADAAVTFEL